MMELNYYWAVSLVIRLLMVKKQDDFFADDDIMFYGIKVNYQLKQFTLGLSMVSVDGKKGKSNTWGHTNGGSANGADTTWQGMKGNEHDFIGYNTSLISEFNEAGETSYQAKVIYDLSHFVSGLSTTLAYISGDIDMDTRETTNVEEINAYLTYDIPAINGLNFKYGYGRNESKSGTDEITRKEHQITLNWSIPLY